MKNNEVEIEITELFLHQLRKTYPYYADWNPTLGSPFIVKKEDPNFVFSLKYGRYNNTVSDEYTQGITKVWAFDGEKLVLHHVSEGDTPIETFLTPATEFIITEFSRRSMLVRNIPLTRRYSKYTISDDFKKRIESKLVDFIKGL